MPPAPQPTRTAKPPRDDLMDTCPLGYVPSFGPAWAVAANPRAPAVELVHMANFAGTPRAAETPPRMGVLRKLSASAESRWPPFSARQTVLLAAGLFLVMFGLRAVHRNS